MYNGIYQITLVFNAGRDKLNKNTRCYMSKCLLIVDVQLGFINASTDHIPALVEALQKKYNYIFVTRFYNKENSLYRKLIKWNRFDKGSDDFKLAFKPASNAVIIDKNIYSCVDASFIKNLNENKIGIVDLCGIDTDICVTKCAVDLFESGITPRVLGNYCGSHAGHESHTHALGVLKRFIGRSQVIE